MVGYLYRHSSKLVGCQQKIDDFDSRMEESYGNHERVECKDGLESEHI